jgi:hypothetical protein
MRRKPANSQFPQGARDLRRWHFHQILIHSRFIVPTFLRRSEQACLVGVERHGPPKFLQGVPRQLPVIGGRVVPHKPRSGRIVDHRNQMDAG